MTVFGRAFPDGVSRADLATILRAGETALTTTTTATSSEDEPVCNELVCIDDYYFFERYSSTYLAVKFRSSQQCSNSWSIEVHVVDSDERRTGDWGIELRSGGASIGDTMTVEIRMSNPDAADSFEYEVTCW